MSSFQGAAEAADASCSHHEEQPGMANETNKANESKEQPLTRKVLSKAALPSSSPPSSTPVVGTKEVKVPLRLFSKFSKMLPARRLSDTHKAHAEAKWVAVEKIHGANFSFTFVPTAEDKDSFWSQRTGPVQAHFFPGHREVVKRYSRRLERMCIRYFGDTSRVHVYGELYGGLWNGATGQHKYIQKGIEYCPGFDFRVFAIKVCDPQRRPISPPTKRQSASHEEGTMRQEGSMRQDGAMRDIGYSATVLMCEKYKVPVLRALHRGTLFDLMTLDPTFSSTIPALHGLKHTNGDKNIAEGYVLSTEEAVYNPRSKRMTRLMLKHKSPKFMEMAGRPNAIIKSSAPLSSLLQRLDAKQAEQVVLACKEIDQHRLDCVRSKHGEIKNERRAAGLLVKDALADFADKEHGGTIPPKLRKVLTTHMMKQACLLVSAQT